MRTFSAIAKKCHKYKRRARIGIARASAARAAARRLIARLAQCFLKQFHAICLAGIGATFAMAAGRYLCFRTLRLVTDRNPSPLAQDFVAFIRSPAGQAVLARSGNLVLQE